MKKYYGYWSNGNTYNRDPYIYTSLREARKSMRAIVRGNDTGSGGLWRIQDEDTERGAAYPVAEGRA